MKSHILPYVVLNIDKKEFHARITAAEAIKLEEKLGKPLVDGLQELDTISRTIDYLHASLVSDQPEITREYTMTLYDEFISEGNSITDMANIILDIMTVSGFFKAAQVEALRKQMALLDSLTAQREESEQQES